MPTYSAPIRDTRFILEKLLKIEQYTNLPGFAEASPDIVAAVLEEGAKYVEEVSHPLNQVGDETGCVRNADGSVTTPPGFKEAYDKLVEGGWVGLGCNPAYGGQGLPHVIASAFEEYMISANMAFTMYMGLTIGAVAAIEAVANEEQKQTCNHDTHLNMTKTLNMLKDSHGMRRIRSADWKFSRIFLASSSV